MGVIAPCEGSDANSVTWPQLTLQEILDAHVGNITLQQLNPIPGE